MFPDASRILRTKWSELGLQHLRATTDRSPETLAKVAEGIALGVDQLAEEIATLLRGEQELTHKAKLFLSTEQLTGSEDATLEVHNYNPDEGYAAKFYGRVLFDPPLTGSGGSATLLWARAQTNWNNLPGNDSYVDCTPVSHRTQTSGGSGTVRLHLPRTANQDPNVRASDILGYLTDANGENIPVTDYLDDPIGTIKGWGDPENIPPGWEITGVGRTIIGYDENDPLLDEIGAVGGVGFHTHDAHDASDIDDHSGYSTNPDGDLALTPTGNTGSADPAVEVDVIPTAATVSGTGTVETGVQSSNPTITAEEYAESEPVTVTDPGHSHILIAATNTFDPGGPFAIAYSATGTSVTGIRFEGEETSDPPGGVTSGFHVAMSRVEIFDGIEIEGDHTHLIDVAEIASQLTLSEHDHATVVTPHTHPISGNGFVAAHTHTIPDMNHTGTLSHSVAFNLPPYFIYCWILRVD